MWFPLAIYRHFNESKLDNFKQPRHGPQFKITYILTFSHYIIDLSCLAFTSSSVSNPCQNTYVHAFNTCSQVKTFHTMHFKKIIGLLSIIFQSLRCWCN
jgi:hypothetical protein